MAFSPDGKTAGHRHARTGRSRLWDVATGRPRRTARGHQGRVSAWPSAPTARLASPGAATRRCRSGTPTSEAGNRSPSSGHTGEVMSVAFSPDGKRLASAGRATRRCRLWDAATGQEPLDPQGAHRGRSPAWPSAPTASGSLGRRLGPDGARSGTRPPARRPSTLKGHTGSGHVRGLQPRRQAPGHGRRDKTVRLWDAATGRGRPHPPRPHRAASLPWPSAPTASAWPRWRGPDERCGIGTGHRHAADAPPTMRDRRHRWPSAPTATRLGLGGDKTANAALGRRDRSHERPVARPLRSELGRGVQPRRHAAWPRPARTRRSRSGTRSTGRPDLTLTGHTIGCYGVAFSPDGHPPGLGEQ